MIKKLLFFGILGILFSCNSGVKTPEQTIENEGTSETGIYGDEISSENPINGKDLLSLMETNDSVWVTMKSRIISNCQHSGCWMDLDLGNNEVIKVTFKDYAFFIPLDSEGKTAIVEGFAKREEIPVDILRHYAEDDGKSQEEIDAITQPEMAYTFEAIGVIIEE
ncbi:MAG: DUF4920 domain-containing protein [Bacteroidales bacterium]|nr:DUF4920 domain-containing protein [Bacteroidales bacterium]MCF8402443.1 DUF4920 domain-containing protein [Bacteroidales bacterium]